MAGYTDIAFRRLCRELGAGLTTTEMVSVRGLLFEGAKTKSLTEISKCESPSSVQFFGSNPADFLLACQKGFLDGFDLIDINMGCPMPKITKNGGGSALLKDVASAAGIVKALVSCGKTVTVKVRLGIKDKINAVDFCRAIEDSGASMIVVHGRTAQQLYSGQADWDAIGEVASKLKIPVIGNGDILAPLDALTKLKTYPISGIMIGRGAISRPDIFDQCNNFPPMERWTQSGRGGLKNIILKHIDYTLQHFSESFTVHKLRKHFAYYFKGIPNIKDLKMFLLRCESVDKMIESIKNTEF